MSSYRVDAERGQRPVEEHEHEEQHQHPLLLVAPHLGRQLLHARHKRQKHQARERQKDVADRQLVPVSFKVGFDDRKHNGGEGARNVG